MRHAFHLTQILRAQALSLKVVLHSAHTGSMFPTTLWESPRSKIQSFIPFVGNIGHFDDEFVLARLGAWKA